MPRVVFIQTYSKLALFHIISQLFDLLYKIALIAF